MNYRYTLRWKPDYYTADKVPDPSKIYVLFQTSKVRNVLSGNTSTLYSGYAEQYYEFDVIGQSIPGDLADPTLEFAYSQEVLEDATYGRGWLLVDRPTWFGYGTGTGVNNTPQGWYADAVTYYLEPITIFQTPFISSALGGGIGDCVYLTYTDTRSLTVSNELDYNSLKDIAASESISNLVEYASEAILPIDTSSKYFEVGDLPKTYLLNGRYEQDLATYVRTFEEPYPWPRAWWFWKVDSRYGVEAVGGLNHEFGLRVGCADIVAVSETPGVEFTVKIQKRPNSNGSYLPKSSSDPVDPQAIFPDTIVQAGSSVPTPGTTETQEIQRVLFNFVADLRDGRKAIFKFGSESVELFVNDDSATIQTALNALSGITAAGGVSVLATNLSGGGRQVDITFNNNGLQTKQVTAETVLYVIEETTYVLTTSETASPDGEYRSTAQRIVTDPGTSLFVSSVEET